MSLRCAKCGSARIVPRATIWDRGEAQMPARSLTAYVYANPDALIFKGTTYATLYARICGDCGYTEIYADGAADLYAADQQNLAAAKAAAPIAEEMAPESVPDNACLSCGKPIPADAKACPACGWTWEATNP
jgi:hypothetical protein